MPAILAIVTAIEAVTQLVIAGQRIQTAMLAHEQLTDEQARAITAAADAEAKAITALSVAREQAAMRAN